MKRKHYLLALALLLTVTFGLSSCKYKNSQPEPSTVSQDSILSPGLLNSERIKMKFGSYGIKVLNNNAEIRVSDLYSTEGDKKTTRTFAVVHYPKAVDSVFLKEHTKILQGQSIGAVFKQQQWKIKKKSIYVGKISPSNEFSEVYKLMGGIAPSELAIYIYGFHIAKNNEEYQYAVISEVYHPDYLSLKDLKQIIKDADNYLEETPASSQILEQVESKMKLNYNLQQ
ncbi:hypothetical protein GWK08_16650 [Leptobacterium flavescens]|uniref:Lipoprotein n=1 Tax=Leptobacterium flavescens TaxID=472055 RepID=A0A6P0UXA2_9FLAO|nr:hypothetical protein [Leptobacterium flavescens]NER15086.1 hypothetical protein [Leptobacterium flavescens]